MGFWPSVLFDTVSNVLLKKDNYLTTQKILDIVHLFYSNFGSNFRQVDLSQLKFKDRDILQDGHRFFLFKADYFWQKILGGIMVMAS